MLVDTRGGFAPRALVRSRNPAVPGDGTGRGLTAAERVLVLQENSLFAGATTAQLLTLATIAREVPLAAGAELAGDVDSPAIYLVLRGRLVVEPPGGAPLAAGAGDAVGIFEALARVRGAATVTVSETGAALRIDGRDLYAALGEDLDLLRGLFSAVLRMEAEPPASLGTPAIVDAPRASRL
jgi:hypothetical protein